MQFSPKGLAFLAENEGEIDHVYRDAGGLKTLGIGHLLTKTELSTGKICINGLQVDYSNGITHQQSLDLLDQDVSPAETCVNHFVTTTLNQDQFDALVSFTFNCGVGAFQSSTLLKKVNASLFTDVPAQLMLWTKAGGKTCDGLITRRSNECKLWNSSI
jgi:lysozyme